MENTKIKGWSYYEIGWLLAFSIIGLIISIMQKSDMLGLFVFMSGIFCVVLAAKGNIWTYYFGLINSFGYAYIAYKNGLFGEMGLNLIFFVPTNIMGVILWKKKMRDKTNTIMRELTNKYRVYILVITVLSVILLGVLLSLIKGQNNPFIDAITNVLSIIATFLMMYRYKEQWILYITLNCFTVALWIIRLKNGSLEAPIMIIMWSAFLVNAIYGYINWSAGVRAVNKEENN